MFYQEYSQDLNNCSWMFIADLPNGNQWKMLSHNIEYPLNPMALYNLLDWVNRCLKEYDRQVQACAAGLQ